MRNKLLIETVFVALAATPFIATAQVASHDNTAAVKRAIEEVWNRVIEADKRGDAAAVAAVYAEDAMIIDPSAPTVTGRANIEKFYKNGLATTKVLDVTRIQSGFETSGNLAVETGTYTQRVQETGKSPAEARARYTVVFENVNGRWLVSRDVATPLPAEARLRP